VRQALAHTLDKNVIVNDLLLGFGKPADGPLHSASPFYNPRIRRYEYSLDKANRLLDEAGYRRGPDGTRFKLTIDFIPGAPEIQTAVAEYMREQGKKVGIDLQLRNSPDFPTWAGRMGNWEYDLSLDVVFNWPDPVIGVERTYISGNIKKAVWTNTMGYSNPKVDELFAQAQREGNFERRKALYHQVQDVLTAELPLIWVNEIGYFTVYSRDFDGLPMDVWGTMGPYDAVTWKKAR
jgi:peptide/nickel transport system substrate-binding protein